MEFCLVSMNQCSIAVQFKDPGNNTQTVRRLKLSLRYMVEGPPASTLAKKLVNDVVANGLSPGWDITKVPVRAFGSYNLQVSGESLTTCLFKGT